MNPMISPAADMDGDKYSFIAEWFDPLAQITRQYYLNFYVNTGSTEMIDIRTRKLFLKKSKVEKVGLNNMYVGSTIHIFGRALTIVDFADKFTDKILGSKKERTFAIIKPDAVNKIGEILTLITNRGFLVTKMRMCSIDRRQAADFYREHQGKPFFENLVAYISRGPIMVLELMGSNAVSEWRKMIGPTDPVQARVEDSTCLRARFGKDKINNAIHGSDDLKDATRETEFFFPSDKHYKLPSTATYDDCTCCIIKPHAVAAGMTGQIIDAIQCRGFEVSMMGMFYMEKANIEEFLEVYRGVVHEYPAMVEEMRMGPCVAMEIRGQDAAKQFREFTGPVDPEIARQLRPNTLRAKFGKDKIQNAVHCTDLPEDAELEVQYFFKILDRL